MRLRLYREQDGMALVLVLMVTMVTLALVSVIMVRALGSQDISRHDQDWNGSLSAAEAGIDDYLYRLNRDGNYWLYSKTSPPPDGNQAFAQYVGVPGAQSESLFTYTPDASKIKIDGTIKLTVTGKIRNAKRTIYATLRRRSFLDYLYYTNYETKDPAAYGGSDPFTPAEAQVECGDKHYYDVPGRDPQCVTIYFISADTINGPLHSNDAINISGNPQFKGNTSTSWNDPAGKRWRGSGSPSFANPGDPKYVPQLTMPPSNQSIKTETNPLFGGTGCLYTGPTQITLNSTGTMNVVSPLTKNTMNAGCGPGTGLALPQNGVVYVQNVPAVSTDPNYWGTCPTFSPSLCNTSPYLYPKNLPVPITSDLTIYGWKNGDTFVSGTLKGQLTIAAENNVVIQDHLKYQGGTSGTDLLGLVANNYVQVFHPVDCTSGNDSSCDMTRKSGFPGGGTKFTNPIIQAANLSVTHSIIVQHYEAGDDLGTLNVTGVIAQKYRGPVGTFGCSGICSGYAKNYVYDGRLKYLSPPHFLDPVAASWQTVTWGEIGT
jgi:hypothetical protein